MSDLFNHASDFNEDISGWNTSAVTNMESMFYYAKNFNQDIGTSIIDASMSPTDTSYMAWDTSCVTDMSYMFYYAESFNGDISGWDTSLVATMRQMFNGATAFNHDIGPSIIDASMSPTDASYTAWDTSTVTTTEKMFYGAVAFNGDISGWDTSSVTNMDGMFYYATVFNRDISGWDTSSVTNMDGMFYYATVFNQDLSNWCVPQFDTVPDDFATSSKLSQDNSPVWGVGGSGCAEHAYTISPFNSSGLYLSPGDDLTSLLLLDNENKTFWRILVEVTEDLTATTTAATTEDPVYFYANDYPVSSSILWTGPGRVLSQKMDQCEYNGCDLYGSGDQVILLDLTSATYGGQNAGDGTCWINDDFNSWNCRSWLLYKYDGINKYLIYNKTSGYKDGTHQYKYFFLQYADTVDVKIITVDTTTATKSDDADVAAGDETLCWSFN